MAETTIQVCDWLDCKKISVCALTIDHTNSQATRVMDLCETHYEVFRDKIVKKASLAWQKSDSPRSYVKETWTDVPKK